jgi:tetratricopeptide (TPR) repeat protein
MKQSRPSATPASASSHNKASMQYFNRAGSAADPSPRYLAGPLARPLDLVPTPADVLYRLTGEARGSNERMQLILMEIVLALARHSHAAAPAATSAARAVPSSEPVTMRVPSGEKAADLTGAMADFDKVIEMNPSPSAEVYFFRGNIRFMNSEYLSAIKEYDKAIEIKSDYAKAFFNKGLSEHNLNQNDESCRDFKRSKELGYPEAQAAVTKYCN